MIDMLSHIVRRARLARLLCALAWMLATPASSATLNFTVTASEPVTVTGTPRLAIDVGGVTRYATYASGSGTAALTFSYAVQAGDFDANGITIATPLDLNGGTLTDLAGNPSSALNFTVPDTAALKVQTYTAAFTTSPITEANANAVSFAIAKAPMGASFSYGITSSGGAGTVSGSGTISGANHSVANVDISALPAGTLTLSVSVSTAAGGAGAAKTASAAPTFTGVLDGFTAPAFAFSVRRLSTGHAGPLLRLRRASDNAEQDIGATTSGNLDIATLTTFCGTSSCFISAWYDQSGNGRNATQNLTTRQPRLVNAGTLDVDGGRPAPSYTASLPLLRSMVVADQTVAATISIVARGTDPSTTRYVLGDRGFCPCGRAVRGLAGGNSYSAFNTGGASVVMNGATTQQRVISAVSGSSGMSGALDGTVTTGGTSSYFQPSLVPFLIGGSDAANGAPGDWLGTISEVMLFNATLTTSARQALERNQGAYYGIAVQ